MKIVKEGSKVKILLEGKLEDGTVFDKRDKNRPIEFIVGEGKLLPKIEDAIKGMKTGEKKSIKLKAKEAFGERKEELIKDIPKAAIKMDKEPQAGDNLLLRTPDGRAFPATIVKVGKETFKIDINHPLAGKNVTITIEVLAVE